MAGQKRLIDIFTGGILFSCVWCLGVGIETPTLLDGPLATVLIGIAPPALIFLILAVPLAGYPNLVRWAAPTAAVLFGAFTIILTSPLSLLLVFAAAAAGLLTFITWGKRLVSRGLILILLLVIAFLPSTGTGGSGPRLLVLGIDAVDHEIVVDLMSRGKLPSISSLTEQGAFGPFETEQPIISPVLWTTIATGKGREAHGVDGFYNTSDHVRVKRLWDILVERGWSIGLFRWLVTWPPPEEVNGFWIPDQMSRDGRAVPPEYGLINELRDLVKGRVSGTGSNAGKLGITRYAWPLLRLGVRGSTVLSLLRHGLAWAPELSHSGPHRYLFMRKVEMELNCDLFLELLRTSEPEFAAFYDNSVDMVGHRYWDLKAPADFESSGAGVKPYGSAVTAIYRWMDTVVGRILSEVSPSTHIVLVSDHGQKAADRAVQESWIISGDSVVESLGLGEHVYVTVIGARPYLFPVRSDEKDLVEEIVRQELERIVITDRGSPLLEVRNVPSTGLPYLALTCLDLSAEEEITVDKTLAPLSRFVHRYFTKTGLHDRYGVIVLAGPEIRSGTHLESAKLRDLVPTLLFWEGLPVAQDMNGKVLLDVFSSSDRPRYVETYESGTPDSTPAEVDVDPVLKERLRALGYLD